MASSSLTWCVLPAYASNFHNTTYSKCVTSLNLRTPKLPSIKEGEVWDKEMILNYLRSQPNNEDLSLGYLGKKAATLILLCTARRFKDVVNLNLSSCTRNNFQYTFVLTRPSKTYTQSTYEMQRVTIKRFKDKKVCPYNAISHYINKTKNVRRTQFLFVTSNNFKSVAPATLSRWVKNILQDAGVDTTVYKPHTTRHASASSFAYSTNNLAQTLKLGCWKTTSSFYKHYLRKPVYYDQTNKKQDIVTKQTNMIVPNVVKIANYKLKNAINRKKTATSMRRVPHTDAPVHVQEAQFETFVNDNSIVQMEDGVNVNAIRQPDEASTVSTNSFNSTQIDNTIMESRDNPLGTQTNRTRKMTFPEPHHCEKLLPVKLIPDRFTMFVNPSQVGLPACDDIHPEDSVSMAGTPRHGSQGFETPEQLPVDDYVHMPSPVQLVEVEIDMDEEVAPPFEYNEIDIPVSPENVNNESTLETEQQLPVLVEPVAQISTLPHAISNEHIEIVEKDSCEQNTLGPPSSTVVPRKKSVRNVVPFRRKKDYQRTDFNKAFDAPIQDPDLEEVSEQFFNEAPLNAYKNIPRNFDFKNHMPSLVKLFPRGMPDKRIHRLAKEITYLPNDSSLSRNFASDIDFTKAERAVVNVNKVGTFGLVLKCSKDILTLALLINGYGFQRSDSECFLFVSASDFERLHANCPQKIKPKKVKNKK